jgi:hypothetical protein
MKKSFGFSLLKVLFSPRAQKKVTSSGTMVRTDVIEFESAYNLLIHLVLASKSAETLLPQIIADLASPPSFPQGPSLSIAVLATLFNVISEYPALQFQVFKTILSISKENNLYDYVSPYFKSVNPWLKEWNVSEQDQSQIWATIISMAETAEDRYLKHSLAVRLYQ